MMNYILFEGKIKKDSIKLNTAAKALNYGSGLFETLLYRNGKLYFFDEHLNRLKLSIDFFNYKADLTTITLERILKLIKKNKQTNLELRIKLLCIELDDGCSLIAYTKPYKREEKSLTISLHKDLYLNPLNKHKRINYHNNIFWKNYYKQLHNSNEVIFLNKKLRAVEGSYTNILAVWNKNLYYVSPEENYLQGIMQKQIIKDAAKIGFKKVISKPKGFPVDFLQKVDEVILTNSLLIAASTEKIISYTGRIIEKKSNIWTNKIKEFYL